MKVVYLGTAAAEGIPAMFCGCEVCKRALARGGRNIMTRSQMLIDEGLLIDFAADTYSHFLSQKKTLCDIEHILITHAHTDHFTFEEFFNRYEGIAYNVKVEKVKMYMSEYAYKLMKSSFAIRNKMETEQQAKRFEFIILKPYEEIKVGEYMVTPLPAVHAAPKEALLFLIEKDGKTLFYGNDTGYFPETIDDYLVQKRKKIDLLSLDCTKCNTEFDYYTHMTMLEGKRIADRFMKKGLLSENVKLYYNHFSHNGAMIYDELKQVAKEQYGFEVSYDGLVVVL